MTDLDEIERVARRAAEAHAKVNGAPTAYTRWDARQEATPRYEDLAEYAQDIVDLIARVRAAEERATTATAKALQAAAQRVLDAESHVFDAVDEAERDAFLDDLADEILELSAAEIDRIDAAQEAKHA